MKQYLLFAGSNYYPLGGINDLRGDFDSVEDADSYFILNKDKYYWGWYQIIENSTMKVIKKSR